MCCGVVCAGAPIGPRALIVGLIVSTAYLGWSLIAKQIVDDQAQRDLAALGLDDAPRFSVPMPFNTLLWRVVAMTPNGYVIGDRSLVADSGAIRFTAYQSDTHALEQVRGIDAVEQLAWFNHGFMRVQVVGETLVLSDLRLGLEPDYNFSFVVAERADGAWRAVPPRQLRSPYRPPVPEGGFGKALADLWTRIWNPPAGAAVPTPGR